MPPRYLIIFAVVILTAQLFIYVTNRGLRWYLKPYIGAKCGLALSLLLWIVPNILMVITASRIFPQFRITAFVLFLLAYAFMLTLGLWLLNRLSRWLRKKTFADRTLRIAVPLLYIFIIGLGLYNAYTPRVQHYAIQSDKLQGSLRIGMVADLHLGQLFGTKQLDKLVQIMHAQQVDIILMPGDIMDDNLDYYLSENMQPHLQALQAPLGVYATLGNHDIREAKAIRLALQQAGVQVLADEAVLIENRFVVVGRNDHLDKSRLPLAQLVSHLPQNPPFRILLDHRPDDIRENSELALDMQVSGHAHKGQVFPANLITAVMYPLDHGYLNLNNRHFFVTSGYGFWGIPFRIGSQSEVMIIDINR